MATFLKTVRGVIIEMAQRKRIPVLVIDEAQELPLEVFAQLHTLGQFNMDLRPF